MPLKCFLAYFCLWGMRNVEPFVTFLHFVWLKTLFCFWLILKTNFCSKLNCFSFKSIFNGNSLIFIVLLDSIFFRYFNPLFFSHFKTFCHRVHGPWFFFLFYYCNICFCFINGFKWVFVFNHFLNYYSRFSSEPQNSFFSIFCNNNWLISFVYSSLFEWKVWDKWVVT